MGRPKAYPVNRVRSSHVCRPSFFDIPRGSGPKEADQIKRNDQFQLVVFDAQDLPTSIADQTITPYQKRDHLYFKKITQGRIGEQKSRDASPIGSLLVQPIILDPPTSGTAPRTGFVASGTLPAGNNDVACAPNETELVNVADRTMRIPADWAYTNGTDFWVFFPAIASTISAVHLTVVYSPNQDEEESRNIQLT